MTLFRSRTVQIFAALVAILLLVQYVLPISLIYKSGAFQLRKIASQTGAFNFTVENKPQQNESKPIREMPPCPEPPPNLVGPINISISDPPTMEELVKLHPEVEAGGRWRPLNCTARHRMAIVIPFRNRDHHLRVFLYNMHPFLQKQQLDYSIIVVDQALPTRFNRAMLMNIGFAEGLKLYDYQCFIFHDVDLIPEDDRNIYSCPLQPRHMSVAIDKFNYRLPYGGIFGGVSALNVSQFKRVNGFSNMFFGWGGEDDDMSNRVRRHYKISRYPLSIARYKMIKHQREKGNEANPVRMRLINTGPKRYSIDGVGSLEYERLGLELRPLYTWVNVMINQTIVEQRDEEAKLTSQGSS